MMIDCDTCVARGPACGDCVVTVLLGSPVVSGEGLQPGVELDGRERAAIAVLAGAGLVPPLRLVRPENQPPPPNATQGVVDGLADPGDETRSA